MSAENNNNSNSDDKPFVWYSLLSVHDFSVCEFVCLDVSNTLVVLGTSVGSIFFYGRDTMGLLKVVQQERGEAITMVKVSLNEQYLAYATARHALVVIKLEIGRPHEKEKTVMKVTDHKATISCLLWDNNDERIFSADENGFVHCTRVSMSIKNRFLPELSSEILLQCQSAIVQLDFDGTGNRLLVSNLQRVLLYDLESTLMSSSSPSALVAASATFVGIGGGPSKTNKLWQVGPERGGKLGACFDRNQHDLRSVIMALPNGSLLKVDTITGDYSETSALSFTFGNVYQVDSSTKIANTGMDGPPAPEHLSIFGTYLLCRSRRGFFMIDPEVGEVLSAHVDETVATKRGSINVSLFRNHSVYILHNKPAAKLSLGRVNPIRCVELLLSCGENALNRCVEVAWGHQINNIQLLTKIQSCLELQPNVSEITTRRITALITRATSAVAAASNMTIATSNSNSNSAVSTPSLPSPIATTTKHSDTKTATTASEPDHEPGGDDDADATDPIAVPMKQKKKKKKKQNVVSIEDSKEAVIQPYVPKPVPAAQVQDDEEETAMSLPRAIAVAISPAGSVSFSSRKTSQHDDNTNVVSKALSQLRAMKSSPIIQEKASSSLAVLAAVPRAGKSHLDKAANKLSQFGAHVQRLSQQQLDERNRHQQQQQIRQQQILQQQQQLLQQKMLEQQQQQQQQQQRQQQQQKLQQQQMQQQQIQQQQTPHDDVVIEDNTDVDNTNTDHQSSPKILSEEESMIAMMMNCGVCETIAKHSTALYLTIKRKKYPKEIAYWKCREWTKLVNENGNSKELINTDDTRTVASVLANLCQWSLPRNISDAKAIEWYEITRFWIDLEDVVAAACAQQWPIALDLIINEWYLQQDESTQSRLDAMIQHDDEREAFGQLGLLPKLYSLVKLATMEDSNAQILSHLCIENRISPWLSRYLLLGIPLNTSMDDLSPLTSDHEDIDAVKPHLRQRYLHFLDNSIDLNNATFCGAAFLPRDEIIFEEWFVCCLMQDGPSKESVFSAPVWTRKFKVGAHKVEWGRKQQLNDIVGSAISGSLQPIVDKEKLLALCLRWGFVDGSFQLLNSMNRWKEALAMALAVSSKDLVQAVMMRHSRDTQAWKMLLHEASVGGDNNSNNNHNNKEIDTKEVLCLMVSCLGLRPSIELLMEMSVVSAEGLLLSSSLSSSLIKDLTALGKQQLVLEAEIAGMLDEIADHNFAMGYHDDADSVLPKCKRWGVKLDEDHPRCVRCSLRLDMNPTLFDENEALAKHKQSGHGGYSTICFPCGHMIHEVCCPEQQCVICLQDTMISVIPSSGQL